jgi:hypothetical protein
MTQVFGRVVVLLTANTTFNGKDYTLVFWRSQNARNPQNGTVALQSTMFVHQNDKYAFTRDLANSHFGKILLACHISGGIWKYSFFEKALTASEFPQFIYQVQ